MVEYLRRLDYQSFRAVKGGLEPPVPREQLTEIAKTFGMEHWPSPEMLKNVNKRLYDTLEKRKRYEEKYIQLKNDFLPRYLKSDAGKRALLKEDGTLLGLFSSHVDALKQQPGLLPA